MVELLIVAALAVAIVAGVRSTWSPCGLSMLATITPLAESGRGNRYRSTAAWFVVGSVVGGACFGGVMALLAIGVHALDLSALTAGVIGLGATAVVLVSDSRVVAWSLPVHHRQVNERWLDRFRPWVYGAGFGWQIGCALATYIMTGAVYLTMALGALSGRPWAAMAVGTVFGLVRGLAVLLGRGITTPEALRTFHRRFFALGRSAAHAAVAVEAVVLTALALGVAVQWSTGSGRSWDGAISVAALVGAVVVATLALHRGVRQTRRRIRTGTPADRNVTA